MLRGAYAPLRPSLVTKYVGLTHGAEVDSDCRQCPLTADLSFYYFLNPPPSRLSFYLCVSRCTGVFPVGSFAEHGSSEWSRVPRAAGSVARVCRLTPFCSRTTLCLLSLLHHRGRWVSLTYHGAPMIAHERPSVPEGARRCQGVLASMGAQARRGYQW